MLRKRSPEARQVHAVLAAAMADPELLENWRSSPSARKKIAAGAADLDMEKVWRFSGLVTKVRHNDVRLIAPFAFKLLDLAGISVEMFAAYARQAHALRKDGKKSPSEKLLSLSNFLDEWLDHDNSLHSLIWDLIRHESAVHKLQTEIAPGMEEASAPVALQASPELAPVPREFVVHYEMTCNPIELVRGLRAETKIPLLFRGQYYFAYCLGNDTGRVKVLELDAIGSVILDLADGRRTIAKISNILRKAGIPLQIEDLYHAVSKLVAEGLLVAGSSSGA